MHSAYTVTAYRFIHIYVAYASFFSSDLVTDCFKTIANYLNFIYGFGSIFIHEETDANLFFIVAEAEMLPLPEDLTQSSGISSDNHLSSLYISPYISPASLEAKKSRNRP